MLIALIARDRSGALQTRLDNLSAHLTYSEKISVVIQAGPLLYGETIIGLPIILEVNDMETAKNWARNDPYMVAGHFDSVKLLPWKRVIG